MFRWRRPYVDWRLFLYYPTIALGLAVEVDIVFRSHNGLSWWQLPIEVAGAALAFGWLWGLGRMGIYHSGEGVRIRRFFTSRTLLWGDIAAVCDLKPVGLIGFRLVSGDTVRSNVRWSRTVVGMTLTPIFRRGAYDRIIAKLEDLRIRSVGAPPE